MTPRLKRSLARHPHFTARLHEHGGGYAAIPDAPRGAWVSLAPAFVVLAVIYIIALERTPTGRTDPARAHNGVIRIPNDLFFMKERHLNTERRISRERVSSEYQMTHFPGFCVIRMPDSGLQDFRRHPETGQRDFDVGELYGLRTRFALVQIGTFAPQQTESSSPGCT